MKPQTKIDKKFGVSSYGGYHLYSERLLFGDHDVFATVTVRGKTNMYPDIKDIIPTTIKIEDKKPNNCYIERTA